LVPTQYIGKKLSMLLVCGMTCNENVNNISHKIIQKLSEGNSNGNITKLKKI
jgi:hypothetical protein